MAEGAFTGFANSELGLLSRVQQQRDCHAPSQPHSLHLLSFTLTIPAPPSSKLRRPNPERCVSCDALSSCKPPSPSAVYYNPRSGAIVRRSSARWTRSTTSFAAGAQIKAAFAVDDLRAPRWELAEEGRDLLASMAGERTSPKTCGMKPAIAMNEFIRLSHCLGI